MCSYPSMVAHIGAFADNWSRKCSQMSRARPSRMSMQSKEKPPLQHSFQQPYLSCRGYNQKRHNSSCYNMVRCVKHLDKGLIFMPVQYTGVIIFYEEDIIKYMSRLWLHVLRSCQEGCNQNAQFWLSTLFACLARFLKHQYHNM